MSNFSYYIKIDFFVKIEHNLKFKDICKLISTAKVFLCYEDKYEEFTILIYYLVHKMSKTFNTFNINFTRAGLFQFLCLD